MELFLVESLVKGKPRDGAVLCLLLVLAILRFATVCPEPPASQRQSQTMPEL